MVYKVINTMHKHDTQSLWCMWTCKVMLSLQLIISTQEDQLL